MIIGQPTSVLRPPSVPDRATEEGFDEDVCRRLAMPPGLRGDRSGAAHRDSLEMAIALTARAWQLRLTERLAQAGLTASQWRALRAVAGQPDGLGQRELAALIGVEEPGVSRLVDTLERLGLVTRRVAPSDRRSRIVKATPAAAAVVAQAREISVRLDQELFAGVPDAELGAGFEVLRRLLNKLQSLKPAEAGKP
jgi:MarR family transcriptional regulator for hemolysin